MDDGWMDGYDDEEKRNTRLHICEKSLATTHDKPILRLSIQMTTRNTKLRTTLTNKPRPNHPHAQRSDLFSIFPFYLACPSSSHSVLFCFSAFLLFSCCILSLFAVSLLYFLIWRKRIESKHEIMIGKGLDVSRPFSHDI